MEQFDIEKQTRALEKTTIDAVKGVFPIKSRDTTLELTSIWADDRQDPQDFQSQFKAKVADRTWGVPIYGSFALVDKDGKVIQKKDKIRLVTLPKLTPRLSYIVNGREYQVANQLRLRPAGYIVRTGPGGLKSQINLSKGYAGQIELHMKPETGVFTVKVGQAYQPLYPILNTLGISDAEIAKRWGDDVLEANKAATAKKYDLTVRNFAKSVLRKQYPSAEAAKKDLIKFTESTAMDGDINQRTIGKPHKKMDAFFLTDMAQSLLRTVKGEREPNDRNSLEFKEYRTIRDLVEERLSLKEHRNKITRTVSGNMQQRDKIEDMINATVIAPHIREIFRLSLAQQPKQLNPVEMFNTATMTTLMGEGGISSPHTIAEDMRDVHPSHLGFLDPLHTPECFDDMTEVFTSDGWKFWEHVTKDDLLACNISGALEFHHPEKLHVSDYKGPMYGMKAGKIAYLVTPNHRVYCRPNDKDGTSEWRIVYAEDAHEKPRVFQCGHRPYVGDESTKTFSLPYVEGNNSSIHFPPIPVDTWAKFLGWYLAEGNSSVNYSTNVYRVTISKHRAIKPDEYEEILSALSSININVSQEDRALSVHGKELAVYCKQFGLSYQKFIPEHMFHAPVSARKILLNTLLRGDGRIGGSPCKDGTPSRSFVFTTSSSRLADDFERLAIGLGYSPSHKMYKDKNAVNYTYMHEIRLLKHTQRKAFGRSERGDYKYQDHYFVQQYEGKVYCATVPGGLLFVRRKGSVGIWSGNSGLTGVVYHLPTGVSEEKKTLLTRAINLKTGKLERIDPAKFADNVIAFPGQYDTKTGAWKNPSKVVVLDRDNKTKTVSSKKVDYILQNPKQVFSVSSNLTPFLPTNSGGRALVGVKLAEQAVPLARRESPLVQSRLDGKTTFEKLLGKAFSFESPIDGVVEKVAKGNVTLRDKSGKKVPIQLYDNFPLNDKSFIDSIVKVNKGDTVTKGQLLADTNFTEDGNLAIGTNLRAAFLPYKGLNFEDAIVITDDAAKKLTSEHMYTEVAKETDRFMLDKKKFAAFYPTVYSLAQRETLDDDGVVKKGTIIQPGDPVIARLRKEEIDPENIVLRKLSKALIRPWRDDSINWEGDNPAKVVDVVRHGKQVKVFLRTEEPATIGDKLVGRYGNKGVVSRLIPAEQAPRDKDGKPVDIILNPHGVITRINVGQLLENAAGKVARKQGTPYITDNFSGENYTQSIKDLLKQNDVTATEELFDPKTNASLGNVTVGDSYIMKLDKQVKSQFSARGAGAGWRYSQNTQEPVKGGEEGSKAMDLLTFYSMLGHGAKENLREMATYKASRNDDFWSALKTGSFLPPPKPTFAYNKFISYMKGAGVDVKQNGSKLVLSPMTDRETDNLSNGEIKEFQFVRAKDLQEITDGLVDKKITGGVAGDKWSHIKLEEPIINPVFEKPVRSLLGMSKRDFSGYVEGRVFLDENGEANTEGRGVTGGNAFKQLLSGIDRKDRLRELQEQSKKAKGDKLNKINRQIRYLEALNRFELEPTDAYIMNKIPILPPKYRPIYALPDGNLHTSGLNFLYRDVGLANDKLREFNKIPYMPEEAKEELRTNLYKGVSAVIGLGNPIAFYPKSKKVQGIIKEIKGSTEEGSKTGFFQRHVIRREQDLVGRGTVIPDPKLGVDELGIPEKMAWTLFEPFVMQNLIRQGYKPIDADKQIKEKSFMAKRALDVAMAERPVIMNRAPSLHKFSIMSFRPKITQEKAVKVPLLINTGFNMDFDGDAATIHTPILRGAVEEARQMFPSQHLFNPGTGNIMLKPQQEAAIGLYFLSRDGEDVTGKNFSRMEDLAKALDSKEINITDIVTVGKGKTSAGKAMIDAVLPKAYRGRNIVLDKKNLGALLTEIAQNHPKDYANTVNQLTELGNKYAYQSGFTVSIDDIQPDLPEKEAILERAKRLSTGADDRQKIEVYQQADKEIKKAIHKRLDAQGNNLYQMVKSGARGNIDQLKQIVSTPLLVEDVRGNTLPLPIENSFSKGLDIDEYWNSLYGSRKGVVDKTLQTSKPGEFNKDLMATVIRNVITDDDCGTKTGLEFTIDDIDGLDRILAKDVVIGKHTLARAGDIITPNLVSKLRSSKVKKFTAHSPLTCEKPHGTCAKCYGVDPSGNLPSLGDNIGAIAGQSLTEPLTQMVLRSMHSGGVAGAQQLTGYEKIDKLVHMPETIHGSATLAKKDGKITSIEKAPAGGRNVFIGEESHFVPQTNLLKVKTGTKVKKGDALSHGIIQPRELVELKGMFPAQRYIVDELTDAYRDTGVNIKKKNVETVVRSLANTTTVLDGGDSSFGLGEVIPYTVAEAFNRSAAGKLPLDDAVDKVLFKDQGPIKKGTKITKRIAKILQNLGHNEVNVGPNPIVHRPFVTGIKQLPLLSKDWMAQLGYGHIARGIREGAGEAWTTDIHNYSPVPAFAYGAEFGKGVEGRY